MSTASGHEAVGRIVALAIVLGFAPLVWDSSRAKGAQPPAGITPGQLPLVDKLGSGTTTYLYRMGWEELQERLKGTTALAVIESRAVQRFFKEMKRLGRRGDELGKTYSFLLSALHQDLVIAAAPSDEDPAGRSAQVAIVRPGPTARQRFAADFEAAMARLEEQLQAEPEPVKIGPMRFRVLEWEDEQIYAGLHGGALYWGVGREAAEMVARPIKGDALGRSTAFASTVAPLLAGRKDKPVAIYYYDFRATWKRRTTGEAAEFWNSLSWTSIASIAGATFVDGNGYRNRHYWKIGPHRTGLFQHSRTSRVNPKWLKRVPAESSGYFTGVWDAFSLLSSLPAMAAAMSGPDGGLDDDDVVDVFEQLSKLKPLCDQVGPRYLVYRVPGKYGNVFPLPVNDIILVSDVRDANAFVEELEERTAEVNEGLVVAKSEFQGRRIWSLTGPMPIGLYLAVGDKELFLTFNPQLIEDAIENWDDPVASLVDTPAYKAVAKYKQSDACFELYFPPDGFTRGFYDQYVPVFQQTLGMFGGMGSYGSSSRPAQRAMGLHPGVLPRGSTFTRRVKQGTILTGRDDGQGVLFDGHAPVLCTPYYWVYLHALAKLQPAGMAGFGRIMQYMLMPVEQDRE